MTDREVRIVVVDDHQLVRTGLRGVLDGEAGLVVVAEAADGIQAIGAVEVHRPDVVVMDLQMPSMGGVEATSRILAARPSTAVLVLTMFDDDDSVFAAVQAGARGYVLKGAGRDELKQAVRAVASGHAVFGPGVAGLVLTRLTRPVQADDAFPQLTRRELDVLRLLTEDLAPAAIGRRLGISEKSVRNLISSTLTKLQVTDRMAAIAAARRAGLVRQPTGRRRAILVVEPIVAQQPTPSVRQAVETAVAAHGGVLFADGMRAHFPEGGAAAHAGLDAMDAITASERPAATTGFGAGIHTGTFEQTEAGPVGVALHEAARVTELADDGQVLATYEALPHAPPGIELWTLTHVDLLGVDRKLRINIVRRPGAPPPQGGCQRVPDNRPV